MPLEGVQFPAACKSQTLNVQSFDAEMARFPSGVTTTLLTLPEESLSESNILPLRKSQTFTLRSPPCGGYSSSSVWCHSYSRYKAGMPLKGTQLSPTLQIPDLQRMIC